MTYPQAYQQFPPQPLHQPAPQGYPQQQPPAQQYGAPQGYPGAVVTYPQSPAQPAGPPQGQGLVPSTPQLRDGGGGGGQASPKLRHLIGCTIVVEPIRVDETAMDTSSNPPKPRPEAYFHLTVVRAPGGKIQYGDNQDRDVTKQRPNTHEIDVPCRFTNMNDYGQAFVRAVRDALAAGEPGRAGVVEYGTRGNKPPMITKCGTDVHGNARPDGDARFAEAMSIFDLIWKDTHDKSGGPRRFVSPEPRSLVVAPPAGYAQQVAYGAPPQPQYAGPPQGDPNRPYLPTAGTYGAAPQQPYQSPAPAGYAQQQYQQTGTVPTPYGAAPAAQLHPEYVAAATQPTYNPYAAGTPLQQGGGVYAQPQSAPPAPNEPPLPPPVEAWLSSLAPEQRAISRAQYVAQQQAQGTPQVQAQPAGPGM